MGGGGSCGVSANEYSCAHGAQINFGHLTPYLTNAQILLVNNWNCFYLWISKKIVLLHRICNAHPQPTERRHPCERAGHEQKQQGRNESCLWSSLGLVSGLVKSLLWCGLWFVRLSESDLPNSWLFLVSFLSLSPQCCGSMTFCYGSGSESDMYLWLRFWDPTQVFCLLLFEATFTSFFKGKKS